MRIKWLLHGCEEGSESGLLWLNQLLWLNRFESAVLNQ